MAAPVLVDTHMHIYPTKDHGHRQKGGGYVVWEYGDKPELSFSKLGGDLEDALSEIKRNNFTKTVIVNLFSAPGERFHEVSKLGEGASGAEKQKVIDEINATLKQRAHGVQQVGLWPHQRPSRDGSLHNGRPQYPDRRREPGSHSRHGGEPRLQRDQAASCSPGILDVR